MMGGYLLNIGGSDGARVLGRDTDADGLDLGHRSATP
jgi:hypothetical protein